MLCAVRGVSAAVLQEDRVGALTLLAGSLDFVPLDVWVKQEAVEAFYPLPCVRPIPLT